MCVFQISFRSYATVPLHPVLHLGSLTNRAFGSRFLDHFSNGSNQNIEKEQWRRSLFSLSVTPFSLPRRYLPPSTSSWSHFCLFVLKIVKSLAVTSLQQFTIHCILPEKIALANNSSSDCLSWVDATWTLTDVVSEWYVKQRIPSFRLHLFVTLNFLSDRSLGESACEISIYCFFLQHRNFCLLVTILKLSNYLELRRK